MTGSEWHDSLLAGEVALVTGGGQGIGLAVARQLGLLGARVVILDVDPRGSHDILASDRIPAVCIPADVRHESSFDLAIAEAQTHFGRSPTVFVSNAGITRDSTVSKMTADQWREVIDVHLTSGFLGLRAVLGGMRALGRGSIVFVSSISAFGAFGQANYSSAKAGLVGLARTAALEVARYGIRVNCVAPGIVNTAMVSAVPEDVRQSWLPDIPLSRVAEPDEIARVISFLCSPLASYVTGAVLVADGGYSLKG